MRHNPLLFLLGMLAATGTVSAAAPCPANPLAALSGPWTFNIQQSAHEDILLSYGLAGTFTATIGADRAGSPIGVLTINATSLIDYNSTRLENDIGRFQINADCSGGTLTFNLSSRPTQFDFWFYDGNRSINIVGTVQGLPLTGTAHVGPAAGCPAGVASPEALFSGPYAFKFRSIFWHDFDPVLRAYVIAGRMVAERGLLRITATLGLGGPSSVARLEQDAGSYQVNADCSGGTLTFNLSSRPVQLQFYFRAGFDEIDVISTSGPSIVGIVSRAPLGGCPANPLSALSGTWTYNVQTLWVRDTTKAYSAAGQFRASVGTDRAGNPIGILALNATSILFQSITRLEQDAGRFQINADCTGGTLTFNLSSYPQQYDFWFHNNGIYLVSTLQGAPITGSATAGAAACPAGVTPLSLLTGLWSFRVHNVDHNRGYGFTNYLAKAGLMNGTVGTDRAGNPLGVLAITATTINKDVFARLESDAGRYQVNDDCSGGTLTFNLSSRPVQYQFYFRAGFNQFDAITASTNGPWAWGLFSR